MFLFILGFLLVFPFSGNRKNTVFIVDMDFIFGETGHIAGDFVVILQILDINLRYSHIIFINRRNIIKEMIQNTVTE